MGDESVTGKLRSRDGQQYQLLWEVKLKVSTHYWFFVAYNMACTFHTHVQFLLLLMIGVCSTNGVSRSTVFPMCNRQHMLCESCPWHTGNATYFYCHREVLCVSCVQFDVLHLFQPLSAVCSLVLKICRHFFIISYTNEDGPAMKGSFQSVFCERLPWYTAIFFYCHPEMFGCVDGGDVPRKYIPA